MLVVDPRRRTATAYRSTRDIRVLAEADTLDASDVVPGWTVQVGAFFGD